MTLAAAILGVTSIAIVPAAWAGGGAALEAKDGATVQAAARAEPSGRLALPEPAFDSKIVGGTTSTPGDWPWMVALLSPQGGSPASTFFCGGSLIDPYWVLTAAHCVDTSSPGDLEILAGRQDLGGVGGEIITVSDVIVHPAYAATDTSDIALLRLSSPASAEPVSMIVPGQETLWTPGTIATVSGWGCTTLVPVPDSGECTSAGEYPDELRDVEVPLVSDADCTTAYGANFVPATELCAGVLPAGGVDTCFGDSGGPIVVPDGVGGWVLIGATSWGFGCAAPTYPGVYARLAALREWVLSNLVPSAPQNAFARRYDGSVRVTWDGSATPGDSPIESYAVEVSPGGAYAALPPSGREATFSGLTNGTAYTFTIYATNATGVGLAATVSATPGRGYWVALASGNVEEVGDALNFSNAAAIGAGGQIVGIAPRQTGMGYWLATTTGRVFAHGDAPAYGDLSAISLAKPIVAITPTPSGLGYWMVASDGGIFSFGDAAFYGSTGAITLNKPIVGMAPTPNGIGYWLVASDGGIFAYGDAAFYGSTGNITLNQPIVGMSPVPSGTGYWMVAADGGIFAYGTAPFYGSTGNITLNEPIIGMTSSLSGFGYRFIASDGGVFSFGDSPFLGAAATGESSAVGIAQR